MPRVRAAVRSAMGLSPSKSLNLSINLTWLAPLGIAPLAGHPPVRVTTEIGWLW